MNKRAEPRNKDTMIERYEGIELKELPNAKFPHMRGPWVPCPKCEGHGDYNKERNGKTVRQFCSQCTGWGYVKEGSPDATCVHVWVWRKNVGNCLNDYTCTKCSHTQRVDSSG